MPSTFPSAIGTLPNPNPTDRLNSPSHSALHQSENAEIVQIETFIGTNASAQGTLTYDIRSPLSNGGGHIQTAIKGGTGQTSFTKGDLLVAQSSSVLAKLAVGVDGQILTVNSSLIAGLGWNTPGGNLIGSSGTQVSIIASATETSILSVIIPGSTLGTSGAVKSVVFIPFVGIASTEALTLKAFYGGTSIASYVVIGTVATNASYFGRLETNIMSKGVTSSQLAFTTLSLLKFPILTPNIPSVLAQNVTVMNTAANAGQAQALGMTAAFGGNTAGCRLDTAGYIVERIV